MCFLVFFFIFFPFFSFVTKKNTDRLHPYKHNQSSVLNRYIDLETKTYVDIILKFSKTFHWLYWLYVHIN